MRHIMRFVFTQFSVCVILQINAQVSFEIRPESRRDETNVSTNYNPSKITGRRFSDITVSANIEDGDAYEKTVSDSNPIGDLEVDHDIVLKRGGHNGKGHKEPPPGRRRGNGNKHQQQNAGRGQGKKKGHNPCGPRGQFCPRRSYINAIGLEWSPRVHNGTGIFIRGRDGSRTYVPVGYQELDEPFGSCITPSREPGNCRHLEHCILEEFRTDFLKFLEYSCPIPYGNFAGVCCSEDDRFVPVQPTQRPLIPLRPISTTELFFPFSPIVPPPRVPNTSGGRLCGQSEQKTSRIVGGRAADPKAWSWMVALIRSKPQSGDIRVGQFCGGVLISEFAVLTAGHCVIQFQPKDIKIRLGEYDFSSIRIQSRPEDFEIASIIVHKEFNRYSYQNDIAILRLTRSAYYSNKIRPICLPLPFEDKSYENEIGIVTGWGTIYYGGPTSNSLMEVSVPIWKQDDCKAAYTQPIEETNLCAGVRSGSRDSCQGDSGGPLQVQGSDRNWRAVGIVSWGIRCSEPGYPGVYTRISKYLNWIASNL